MLFRISCTVCSVLFAQSTIFAAKEIEKTAWPFANNFDIWNAVLNVPRTVEYFKNDEVKNFETLPSRSDKSNLGVDNNKRSRAFHLFPVPVDGECLSDDGRRTGICLNVYECRLKGGTARGECSLGFGVCCIFIASCDQTISNNITYLVSPNFPSSMPANLTTCKIKVKMMESNISQLRIDFNHFSLGQPNRRTGNCEGDVFNVTGGPLGTFSLCGQNSGQHIYYDVGGGKYNRQATSGKFRQSMLAANQTISNNAINQDGTIDIILSFGNRFLPIRFWEIRIAQIPFSQRAPAGCLQYFTGAEGVIQTFNFAENGRHLANQHYRSCIRQENSMCSIMYQPCDDQSFRIGSTRSATSTQNNIMTTVSPEISATNALTGVSQTEASTVGSNSPDLEGSGEDSSQASVSTSRRPVRGGFDIISFFRSAFDFRSYSKTSRQFFTTCSDRITMPCIIEDFVGVGMGPLPGCEPVHCGNQFCASKIRPCRIESTVTPFYLGVHFGDGIGKGSAEDNIGACIQYMQMPCI